jgi:hypothetical protein
MKKLLLSLLCSVFLQAADLSDKKASNWLLSIINQCKKDNKAVTPGATFDNSVHCELANLNHIFKNPNYSSIQTKLALAMRKLCLSNKICLFGGKNYEYWSMARPVDFSQPKLGNYVYTEEDNAKWDNIELLTKLGNQNQNLGMGSSSPQGSVSPKPLRGPSPQRAPLSVHDAISARRSNFSDSITRD